MRPRGVSGGRVPRSRSLSRSGPQPAQRSHGREHALDPRTGGPGAGRRPQHAPATQPSFDGTDPVGSLLAPSLGEDLVIIGGTHTHGRLPSPNLAASAAERYAPAGEEPPPPPPQTLEAALDTAGFPAHLIALDAVSADVLAGATAIRAQGADQTLLVDLALRQAFDAVAHFQGISPVHGADDGDSTVVAR
ncbi:erythromycin esterase family protein [Saccharopolyspora cebuensis]|uniref:Erythromycin esterase family protein n=1 Tax=Saccharopolyspora cebuensis TaxID=418759 RepID=A0ABV4CM69_9PSEU